MSEVKFLKLLNGDELLVEVVSDKDETAVRFKNPVRVVVMPNKLDPKVPSVGFAPWAEFSDDKEFSIDKSHILCIMAPITEFVQQYKGMFGGIVPATSKLII